MAPNIYAGDYRKLIIFPLILIVAALFFAPQIKLGVDFTGGTLIILDLNKSVDAVQLQSQLANDGIIGTVKTYSTSFGNKAEIEIGQNPDLVKADALRDEFNARLDNVSLLEAQSNANASMLGQYVSERKQLNTVADELFALAGSNESAAGVENLNTLKNDGLSAYMAVYNNYKASISKSIDKYVSYSSFSVQSVSPALSKNFIASAETVIFLAFVASIFMVYVLVYPKDISRIIQLLVACGLIAGIGIGQVIAIKAGLLLLLLALVVFYFKSVPSAAIVIGAVADIVIAIGAMGLFGIPLTLASFAALLMLLGFSLDTDILLTMRMLKRAGDPREKAFGALNTGVTMSVTAFFAFLILYLVSLYTHISIYSEISMVALAGLFGDMFATWGINAVILLMHTEGKL